MKLLLHMCCAPCSTYPLKYIRGQGIEVKGLFYNPNIHPREEFKHRYNTVEEYANIVNLDVTYMDDYMEDRWLKFNKEDTSRCRMCYSIRLENAAAYAKEKGFDAFTTSLLVSPYQNHELIKELGEVYSKKYDIDFYYYDFRPFFREGQAMAKEMNLYRQKYCGCILSYNDKLERDKNKVVL